MDEHYHSTNGAIQEARYIYISKAYNFSTNPNPTIFEVGFGTGLNTLLTAIEAEKQQRKTTYITIEKYPLPENEYSQLNFPQLIEENSVELFSKIHSAQWNQCVEISPWFFVKKIHADLTQLPNIENVDVVYFDAFAPNKQASMWTETIFQYLFEHTNNNGVLTTYCAKGDVRRMLQKVGYQVERTDGPPGKREMLRATKIVISD